VTASATFPLQTRTRTIQKAGGGGIYPATLGSLWVDRKAATQAPMTHHCDLSVPESLVVTPVGLKPWLTYRPRLYSET
jgi:hypothetical protein